MPSADPRGSLCLVLGKLTLLLSGVLFCSPAYGQSSTWCHFDAGPLAGQTNNYSPLPALPLGSGCHDGFSTGHIVPPPTAALLTLLDAQLHAQNFSGVVFISENGAVQFNRAYGMANFQAGLPNTADSVFLIGSLTKQFTAAAILKLQENGSLNVGDHICQYLSACPAAWQPITIRELLNHSSGITNYVTLPQVQQFGLQPVTPAQILSWVEPLPLQFPPGAQFEYSNSGYAILGAIIEKVSGRSYGNFMQTTFFGPLGLNSTSYSPGTPISTVGYAGQPVTANRSIAYSAGGITSTAADLGTWVEQLAFGNTLSAASRSEMFSPSIPAPRCPGSYGFGWCIGSLPNGNEIIFHDGDVVGFDSAISIVPNQHLIVVMLSNAQDPNIMTKAENIANSLSY
jgi:CubicO group peptidase (beta-lactamase class C family)